ncbi:MAG: alpha/beta hydrolase [Oligoflexia bacterium]|nr:alpha/beta hydrolase [Oligoflexia bacterium]
MPAAVLLHGLGDRMENMEPLARELSGIGFGTLLVDLHGHGRTLERAGKGGLQPEVLDFRVQVRDLERLIRGSGLDELVLIGHSYGGAIAIALGAALGDLAIRSIHQLAPYVVRLDAFFREKVFGGVFARQPLRHRLRSYDGEREPLPESFLQEQYQRYFLQRAGTPEESLTPEERSWIEVQTGAALAATRGIRGLNLFQDSFVFPRAGLFHLMIGGADALVPPELLLEYRDHLRERGLPLETTTLDGADHFFPQTRAPEVLAAILEKARLSRS